MRSFIRPAVPAALCASLLIFAAGCLTAVAPSRNAQADEAPLAMYYLHLYFRDGRVVDVPLGTARDAKAFDEAAEKARTDMATSGEFVLAADGGGAAFPKGIIFGYVITSDPAAPSGRRFAS